MFGRSLRQNSCSVQRLCIGNKQSYLAEFLSFNMSTDRLDEFYWNYMNDAKHAIIFTLPHGQAAVERECSVNSQLLVENLQVALCIVVSRVMLIISASFF